jgi:hypothetical protein
MVIGHERRQNRKGKQGATKAIKKQQVNIK